MMNEPSLMEVVEVICMVSVALRKMQGEMEIMSHTCVRC